MKGDSAVDTSASQQPSRRRVALASLAVLAAVGLTLAGVRTAGDGTAGTALALVAGAGIAAVIFSAWEWGFHRYLYHQDRGLWLRPMFLTHHRDHHFAAFPPERFTTGEPETGVAGAHPSVWTPVMSALLGRRVVVSDRLLYVSSGMIVVGGGGWLATGRLAFAVGALVASLVIVYVFTRIHAAIHHPGSQPMLEAQPWFPFLARHHYGHHLDPKVNVNFLLPLADWIFGTLRLDVPEPPVLQRRAEPAARRPLDAVRVLLGAGLHVSIVGAILWLAGGLPDTLAGWSLGLLAGLALMPVMASPVEWLVHRYIYHRPFAFMRSIYGVHHRVHHYLFFPTWRYVTGGPPRRIPIFTADHSHAHDTPLSNALTHLAHWTFYMLLAMGTVWIPGWLVARSVPLLLGAALASAVVCDLLVTVHDTIHRPGSHPWIERQPWFRFLDRHHYIHHVDTEANVNFLLPLADWLFGTLRLSLSDAEVARHGTWERAKSLVVGAGEPAHQALPGARPA